MNDLGNPPDLNVFGEPLVPCSTEPMTGYYRNGCCSAGAEDVGRHIVCAEMTAAFLEFSRSRGNDLITPQPQYAFPGLKPGDRWCLVAARWVEAYEAGAAPKVALLSTHRAVLRSIDLETLKRFALDMT